MEGTWGMRASQADAKMLRWECVCHIWGAARGRWRRELGRGRTRAHREVRAGMGVFFGQGKAQSCSGFTLWGIWAEEWPESKFLLFFNHYSCCIENRWWREGARVKAGKTGYKATEVIQMRVNGTLLQGGSDQSIYSEVVRFWLF